MECRIKADLKKGNKNEKVVLYYLNKGKYTEDRFTLYKDPGNPVDFRNDKIIGELKSRSFLHTKHQETFFGYNKLKFLIKNDDPKEWKFYFLFTDGLFVWEYNKEEYTIKDFWHLEKQEYIHQVYVDIKYLVKITEEITFNSFLPHDWNIYVSQK